ncbi:hypothetical protein RND81_13G110300 [Saponaria officinalis]|uniref:Uncharacterized protein n=1 Tax=Saponaria officinalis TaxID=3572 RepID=A0AAW1GYE9_SAPOF
MLCYVNNEIETAVQAVVLREQENATQRVIQNQREVRRTSVLPDDKDVFSGLHDPNAIKEHLLKLTAEHRSEMPVKRGKPSGPEKGLILTQPSTVKSKTIKRIVPCTSLKK